MENNLQFKPGFLFLIIGAKIMRFGRYSSQRQAWQDGGVLWALNKINSDSAKARLEELDLSTRLKANATLIPFF